MDDEACMLHARRNPVRNCSLEMGFAKPPRITTIHDFQDENNMILCQQVKKNLVAKIPNMVHKKHHRHHYHHRTDEDLPVVQAVPVSGGGASNHISRSQEIYFVDLPVGQNDLFQVKGSPPQICAKTERSEISSQLNIGHYIHGLSMPQIEIVNLTHPTHLMQLIDANVGNPRKLHISCSPSYVDTFMNVNDQSAPFYKHELPASSCLGLSLRGFPPVVAMVAPQSPLYGRLHPGQSVEALWIPGDSSVMTLKAGGFTAAKVEARLLETCHVSGRKLVVQDSQGIHSKVPKHQRGTSRPFDDCMIS